ncbi:MAG: LysR family transcriptional regulator substrate-binding protein, partial [Spirochaetales bacterium]|nr:LysR family transcriptional regulator substrate-binding protein [Candidatus Physcosoma equi]
THEGKTLFEYVSTAYSQLVRGENEISSTGDGSSGTIYIAATVTALHCFLFQFLNEYHNKIYPNVRFEIKTAGNNACIELMQKGAVDMAFVTTPCSISKNLVVSNLVTIQDILIAGQKYENLKDTTLSYEDLNSHSLVFLNPNMQLRKFIDSVMEENNILLSPNIELDSTNLIIPMVENNFGLGFVPYEIAKESLEKESVFSVTLEKKLPQRKVIMTYDSDHYQTSASKRFLKMVLERANGVMTEKGD